MLTQSVNSRCLWSFNLSSLGGPKTIHIALGTFLSGTYSRITKLVAVFPQDLSELYCDDIEFGILGETRDTELVVLYLPSFNPEPPADELLKCKYSYHKFS